MNSWSIGNFNIWTPHFEEWSELKVILQSEQNGFKSHYKYAESGAVIP